MAIQNDALMHGITKLGHTRGNKANIVKSGQLGIGNHLPNIDGFTPEVFMPTVAVVTHTPTMFKHFEWAEPILKALIERHAKEISGIDFGYTIEAAGTIVGHDKQELQMPLINSRTAISPSYVFQELKGNLVFDFFKFWMDLIRHPDTGGSALASLLQDTDAEAISPLLISSFCMDVYFIQYDITLRPENIIDAFAVTAQWPYDTGTFGLQRIIGVSQMMDRTIPMYGIMQHNQNTYNAGRHIAEVLNIHKADYSLSTPIATKISDRLSDKGISKEIEDIANEFKEV